MISNELYFLILSIVITVCYSILEGKREAMYYSIKSKSGLLPEINEHPMFSAQRGIFFAYMYYGFYTITNNDIDLSLASLLGLTMIFPFFHDGSYYTERNRLDGIYPKKYFDQSTTSTAFSDRYITPLVRVILLVVGLMLLTFIGITLHKTPTVC